jgi:solute carrier family 25 folate transporter 32
MSAMKTVATSPMTIETETVEQVVDTAQSTKKAKYGQSTKPKRDIFPMIAGGCSGVFSKTIMQPLDLVKTRLQVQDTGKGGKVIPGATTLRPYAGVVDAFTQIIRTEGPLALYTGLAPSLTGSAVSWASYFYTYNMTKKWFANQQADPKAKLPALQHLMSAGFAGSLTVLVTNPVWMIKTRIQIQSTTGVVEYNGALDCLRSIIKNEGFFTLYRGIGPAMMLVSNGAIQFMCYEELKHYTAHTILQSESDLKSQHFLAIGGISKMISATTTYPLQVIKSRLYQKVQGTKDQLKYKNVRHVVSSVRQNEGLSGFYKGLTPQLMKTVPSSALTFFAYETAIRFLNALVD